MKQVMVLIWLSVIWVVATSVYSMAPVGGAPVRYTRVRSNTVTQPTRTSYRSIALPAQSTQRYTQSVEDVESPVPFRVPRVASSVATLKKWCPSWTFSLLETVQKRSVSDDTVLARLEETTYGLYTQKTGMVRDLAAFASLLRDGSITSKALFGDGAAWLSHAVSDHVRSSTLNDMLLQKREQMLDDLKTLLTVVRVERYPKALEAVVQQVQAYLIRAYEEVDNQLVRAFDRLSYVQRVPFTLEQMKRADILLANRNQYLHEIRSAHAQERPDVVTSFTLEKE
jgi:hypothetical protein